MKKILNLTFILMIILLSPAYSSYYSKGCTNYVYKNYDKARDAFLKALELNPHNGNALYFLGEIEKIEQNFSLAEEYFLQAVQERMEKKYKKLAYWNLIILAEQRNDLSATVKYCKEAWEKIREDGARKKIDKIINKLLWTTSKEAQNLYKKGMKSKKNPGKALEYFKSALQLDNTFLAPKFEIGLILYNKGDTSEAIKYLQEIADKIPFHSAVNLLLGNIYINNGSYNNSITYLTNALEYGFWSKHSEYDILLKIGIAHYKLENFEEAIGKINESLEINKKGKKPLYLLSAIYIKQNNYEKALSILKRLYSINKKNKEVIFQIGSLYYKQDNDKYADYFEKLFNLIKTELKSKKNVPLKYYQAIIILAEYHFAINSYQKTAGILEIIPEKDYTYKLNLIAARTYYQVNRYDNAIKYFEKISLKDDDRYIFSKTCIKAGFHNKGKEILLALIRNSEEYKDKALKDRTLKKIAREIIKEIEEKKQQENQKNDSKPEKLDTTKKSLKAQNIKINSKNEE